MDNLEENDFKEEMQEVYPLISDFDFIQKLERIFKSKIERKYKINNILSKSYDEILDLLDDDNIEIKSIFDEFQKAKYSNILIDKKKLLLMVEKI
ncbi:MAG: hypothetical protein LBQ24_03580 [Candidatus Peribacteria bacterium]|jgi:hypothetical protein|nr:hypothetical protein [Candidatus Peribacteria bacterium]